MASQMRMEWLDTLRLIAGVSIVGLHASSDFTGQPFPDYPEAQRVFPVLFRSVIYIARTELFLIISLFLLCFALENRPRSYRVMVAEQTRRLMVPFAFWMVFYAFWRLIKASYFGYDDAIWTELAQPLVWLGYFLLGDVQYHMHFLPTLFGLVLFVPLYKVAINHPAFGFVILLCLFLKRDVDVWMWSELRHLPGFDYLVRAVKIFTYFGYGFVAAAAYGLSKRGIAVANGRHIAGFLLFVGALLFMIKLVYSYKVIQSGNWQYNYTAAYWADFAMPAILFLGVMFWGRGLFPTVISKIAPFSFGLYLCHPIFLDLIEIATADVGLGPTGVVLSKFVGGLAATSLLVFMLSRLPMLAWTIGLGKIPLLDRPRSPLSQI